MDNTRPQRGTKEQKMRQTLLQHIGLGRTAILLLLAVSGLNQLLLLLKVNYHFLFSLGMPYHLNWLAGKLAGTAAGGPLRVIAVIVALLSFIAYGACWMLSAQRREFLKTALLLYCLDTLLLVVFALGCLKNPFSCLLEVLVHVIGIFVLYDAHRSAQQLWRMSRKRKPRPRQEEHFE